MSKEQQKTDIGNGIVVTRQYLWDKGYSIRAASRALMMRGVDLSEFKLTAICRGQRVASEDELEAIKRLPKVVIC